MENAEQVKAKFDGQANAEDPNDQIWWEGYISCLANNGAITEIEFTWLLDYISAQYD